MGPRRRRGAGGCPPSCDGPTSWSGFAQNTWAAGLDRVLAGVAMAEGELLVGEVLPLDDVPSAEVDLAGRLAELVARVTAVRRVVPRQRRRERVAGRPVGRASSSIGSAPPSQAWQVVEFERTLASLRSAATAGSERGHRACGWPTCARCSSVPAGRARPARTSAPARSRCARWSRCARCRTGSSASWGWRTASFPRVQATDGDDVLARDPVTGERDLRSEDRQLLLDAVMAATDRLVITYTGADPRPGPEHPPAVPLGELLDALDVTARTRPVRRHGCWCATRCSPSTPATATAGSAVRCRTRSASTGPRLAGAAAAAPTAAARAALLAAPLRAAAGAATSRSPTCRRFVARPARAFLRQRLDVGVAARVRRARPTRSRSTSTPCSGGRSATGCCGACWPDTARRRSRRGAASRRAAAGHPGRPALRGHRPAGDSAGRRPPQRCEAGRRRVVDVAVELATRTAADRAAVPDVRGDRVVRVYYSALNPRQRLAAWVDLLCLAAAHPDTAWTASTVGLGLPSRRRTRVRARSARRAIRSPMLRDLVDLYDQGMREPLPMPLRTAYAWAERPAQGRRDWWPAEDAWQGSASPADPRAERATPCARPGLRGGRELADLGRRPRGSSGEPVRGARHGTVGPVFEHERVRRL